MSLDERAEHAKGYSTPTAARRAFDEERAPAASGCAWCDDIDGGTCPRCTLRRGSDFTAAPGPEWTREGCAAGDCWGCEGWGVGCEATWRRRELTAAELRERDGAVVKRIGRGSTYEVRVRDGARPTDAELALMAYGHPPRLGYRIERAVGLDGRPIYNVTVHTR